MKEFFVATSIQVGTCSNPRCRGVHINLLDADDNPRAAFSFSCDDVERFVEDIRITRDRIVRGGPNKGLDQ